MLLILGKLVSGFSVKAIFLSTPVTENHNGDETYGSVFSAAHMSAAVSLDEDHNVDTVWDKMSLRQGNNNGKEYKQLFGKYSPLELFQPQTEIYFFGVLRERTTQNDAEFDGFQN